MRTHGRIAALVIGLGLASGCCVSPYRAWQNGWGFNCPEPDRFCKPGPPPPVTTPPGMTEPAMGKIPSSITAGYDE